MPFDKSIFLIRSSKEEYKIFIMKIMMIHVPLRGAQKFFTMKRILLGAMMVAIMSLPLLIRGQTQIGVFTPTNISQVDDIDHTPGGGSLDFRFGNENGQICFRWNLVRNHD